MIYFLAALVTSQVLTAFYIYKLKQQVKAPIPTKELKDFIKDLANGGGLITVRIDSENLILRSPRQ